MAVNLVTVTGSLETLIGATPSIGRLWFKLNRPDWNLNGDIFAPEYIEAIADPTTGAFSVSLQTTDDLEAGASYSVVLKYREPLDNKDREYIVANFMLPSGGPYQLGDLLTVPFVEPVPADILALCQAYAVAAGTAADAAASSAAAAAASAAAAGAPYASYAAATAATVGAGIDRVSVFINGVLVDYIRDATGTALLTNGGAVKWSPANWEVTPYDFGAKGDDATDDSAAFAAMFTWVMSNAGKWRPIFIPPGKFVIQTQFSTTVDPHNNSAEAGLFVRGAGASTVIVNKNRNGWFKWVQASARDVRVSFNTFGIRMANGGSNGRLIDIQQVSGGLSRQSDVVLFGIDIYPGDATVDYAVSFARIKGVYFPKIIFCNFSSPYGPGVTTPTYQRGRAGIDLGGCYGWDVIDTKVWGCEIGVLVRETANPGGEGGRIKGSVIDAAIGASIYSAGGEPALHIVDTHMNCARRNVIIENRKLVNIRDCLWYMDQQPATNLLPRSTDFSLWDGVAAVAAIAEDNDFTTVQTVGDVSGAVNEYRRQLTIPVVSGSAYVLSIIAKQGTAGATRITSTGAALAMEARMVWGAGGVPTVTVAGAQAAASAAIDMGDGWYKVYVTGTAISSGNVNVFLYPADFVGGGSSIGNVLAASMQLELGAEPTSHVETGATAGTDAPIDIDFKNVDWGKVCGMTFYYSSSAQRRNIRADANCSQLIFRNNEHLAAGFGYELAAGIDDVIIGNPTFGPSMNAHITDNGVTSLRVTRDRKLYRHLELATAQSIPNAADTTITWDTNIGSLGFSAVVPASTITINTNRGIRKVRVILQAVWANNSTGAREIKITKNGAIVTGSGHSVKVASGLSYDQVVAEFDVADGDVIRAVVNQTSGGALNFSNSEPSWIKVEEI